MNVRARQDDQKSSGGYGRSTTPTLGLQPTSPTLHLPFEHTVTPIYTYTCNKYIYEPKNIYICFLVFVCVYACSFIYIPIPFCFRTSRPHNFAICVEDLQQRTRASTYTFSFIVILIYPRNDPSIQLPFGMFPPPSPSLPSLLHSPLLSHYFFFSRTLALFLFLQIFQE